MIYLTAVGLTPGGSSTHLHTKQYMNNTNKQCIEQHIVDRKQETKKGTKRKKHKIEK
jgi:hypothetical protein